MRRGLLAWNRDEVPAAVLDARLARLRAAMARDGIDALVIYTSFPRPAAVSFLTHFVPYWSQAALVVPPDGPTALVSALSKRVSGWVHETAHIGEIVSTGNIGDGAAKLISARGAKRVGVVELAKLPGGIGRPLAAGLEGTALVDASALFAAIRHPADATEIALSRRAAAIARDAMDGALAEESETADALIAAIEGAARLAACEEIIVNVAPDLALDARLARIEGDAALGERFAVRASVAYKGAWVRLTRTIDRAGGDGARRQADAALALVAPRAGAASAAAAAQNGVRLVAATAETQIGSAPLSVVGTLPAGAVATVTLEFAERGGPWLAGAPVLVPAAPGTPAERLD